MLAGFAEEIGQIHAPASVRFRRKAYGADKPLIVPEKCRIVKEGTMHAAQIDEIQRCPPQHEQRFYPIAVMTPSIVARYAMQSASYSTPHRAQIASCSIFA